MKNMRLIALLFLLLLTFACFISVPVFGENPWDADSNDGAGSGGTTTDTTGSDDDPDVQMDVIVIQGHNPDWFWGTLFRLSYQFLTKFVAVSQSTAAAPQVTAK